MADSWQTHTLVFDLDDTLFAERDYVVSGFAAADRWIRQHRGIHGLAQRAIQLFDAGHRKTVFNDTLGDLGHLAASDLIAELVDVYRRHVPSIRLSPDAEAVLIWAARCALQLGVVTDGLRYMQRGKIKALGLEPRIPHIVVTDELGGPAYWKPHRAGFLRIMELCPGHQHGYVYVADNPRKDFIAPRELGWHTVRIRRPGGEHSTYEPTAAERADREVSNLFELPNLLNPTVAHCMTTPPIR